MTRILHTARISNVDGVMFVVYFYSLPMFLSRLNESSGGCEKIVPVSESFWSNFKIFKIDRFKCAVVRVKCESEWNTISVFLLNRL